MLLPQIQNSFTCIVDYDDFETVSGYTLYEDYMSQVMELYNGNPIAMMKQENLDGVRDRFFAFSYTPTIGIWKPSLSLISGPSAPMSAGGRKATLTYSC